MPAVHVILGATGGIGRALATELAAHDTALVIAGRDSVALDRLAAEVDGTPCLFEGTDLASVEEVLETAVRKYDRVDGVANCVGSLLLKPAHLTSGEEWDEVMATHLRSSFAAVRAAAPRMRGEGGSIVLVSSAAARTSLSGIRSPAAVRIRMSTTDSMPLRNITALSSFCRVERDSSRPTYSCSMALLMLKSSPVRLGSV